VDGDGTSSERKDKPKGGRAGFDGKTVIPMKRTHDINVASICFVEVRLHSMPG